MDMLTYVKNMLNFLPNFNIFLLILLLIAFYYLGKQSCIIKQNKKKNANSTNDINIVLDKLHKGKF